MKNENTDISGLFDEDETYETITMTDEDGNNTDFIVIDAIEENSVKYILVVSSEDADSDEAEAAILKEVNSDENDAYYEFVEDDDEFKKISVIFQKGESDYEMTF